MSRPLRSGRWLGLTILLLVQPSAPIAAQATRPATIPDSVEIVAGPRYAGGGIRRFFLGSGYRDLWTTPMRLEVLNLQRFAGGLRPHKLGGGNQTQSLRFMAADGNEYVFRSVDKHSGLRPELKGTAVAALIQDQVSTSHPAAALVAARLLNATGILHVTPILAVMPDDSLLGEFREQFAGRLGLMEEFPGIHEGRTGFGGAVAIIDSDSLLTVLRGNPGEQIDAPALLTARLVDMLLGDWDRHGGNWKWARMREGPGASWLPLPRDRDKTFISFGGVILGAAKMAAPNLAPFEGTIQSAEGLTKNSLEFDRRLLGGLGKPVWDSAAAALVRQLTDSVIDDAMLALPVEERLSGATIAAKLKLRRDGLPGAADRFYRLIAEVADIHATDVPDRATVTRLDDRFVEVKLESGGAAPYFLRRFDWRETKEIRLYLHGGADTARITGHVPSSLPVRIIGGNGANDLIDSSWVDDPKGRARLYDRGTVTGVGYGPDTLFNREPWVLERGKLVQPSRGRGAQLAPIIGFGRDHDLGYLPRLGVAWVRYGFGRRPYVSRVGLDAEYATIVGRFRVGLTADHRYEGTPVHLMASARMSKLEVINFHGFGNLTPDSATSFFEVSQTQWQVAPAVGLALGPRSDLSFGPVVQMSVTSDRPNRFITTARPYGSGHFGQAGVRLSLRHDVRDRPSNPHRGLLVDVSGSFFPAVWDVTSPFTTVNGRARVYVTLPVPVHPILVVTGGATKVFGTFPFHEAAFIGGLGTIRSLAAQRYQGDAAEYGSVELRVPVARFALVLPWTVGVFGVVDAGRVFVRGDSPGGWHASRGVGFWINVLDTRAARKCVPFGRGGSC